MKNESKKLKGTCHVWYIFKTQSAEWIGKNPAVYPCETLQEDGVRGFFYEGIKGPCISAWIGIPENASAEKPVPGIVLVHGVLGTIYANWTRYWKNQGYAAIATDTCGVIDRFSRCVTTFVS